MTAPGRRPGTTDSAPALSDIGIATLSQMSDEQRAVFFRRMFPRRAEFLTRHWRWLYRIGYRHQIDPPVLVSHGIMLGHGGAIPVDLQYRGQRRLALYYIDLALLPEFQGTGLGKRLTSVWMQLCPNHLGFNANPKSIVVLRRLGWQPGDYARRCALPLDLAAMVRETRGAAAATGAGLLSPVYRLWLRARFASAPDLEPEPFVADSDVLRRLCATDAPAPETAVAIVRDEDWVRWRILDSPFLDSTRVFRFGDARALVRGVRWQGQRRLHVLLIDRRAAPRERRALLRGIVKWAMRKQVDVVWTVVNGRVILDELRPVLPFHAPVRFVAVSDDPSMLDAIRGEGFEMQGIDCDSDVMYVPDPGSSFEW